MTTGQCYDVINANLLNKCLAISDVNSLRSFSNQFLSPLSPHILSATIIILIMTMPFLFSNTTRNLYEKTYRLYNTVRFTMLSLFHRIAYTYSVVALFRYVIAQPSPCQCEGISIFYKYNMPYIYSFSCAIIGLTLVDFSSFHRVVFLSLAFLIGLVPSLIYVMAGWASIAQVFVSVVLAVCLHIYSKNSSNRVMIIECMFLIALNLAGVIHAAVTRGDSISNRDYMVPSFLRAISTLLYDLYMVIRFLQNNNWSYFTVAKGYILVNEDSSTLRSSFLADEDGTLVFEKVMKRDKRDGFIGFIIILILKFIEHLSIS